MGWLNKAIATPKGYVSAKGEMLKRKKLTPEEIAAHNGTEATEKEEVATAVEVGDGLTIGTYTGYTQSVSMEQEENTEQVEEKFVVHLDPADRDWVYEGDGTKVKIEESAEVDLEELTKKQLEVYAKENNIPLQSKKSKKVILEQLLSQE